MTSDPLPTPPDPDAAGEATARDADVSAEPVVHRLHPHVRRLWFWESAIAGGGVALVATLFLLVRGHYWAILPGLAAVGLAVAALSAYARAYADRMLVHLLPDGLLVQRGVWWRSEVFIPRARVQHTDVEQGPLDRQFGLATLKVFTAASHLGVTEVAGLAHATAVSLRDALLGRQGADGV